MQQSQQMKDFKQAIAPYVSEITPVPGGIECVVKPYPVRKIKLCSEPKPTRGPKPQPVYPPGCSKKNPKRGQQAQVHTPRGTFPSLQAAAQAYGRTTPWVYYQITRDTAEKFYYYQP